MAAYWKDGRGKTAMITWLTIGGMAVVSYLTRSLPILMMWGKPPQFLERYLRYIPPSIFIALMLPDLLLPNGKFELGIFLWSGIAGMVAAYFSRNIVVTLVCGIIFFNILRWLGVQ